MTPATLLTQVLSVSSTAPDPVVIAAAAAQIQAGGLVAFPTETVYGLGANAFDADAVAKIFTAKGRPATNPLIVHIAAPEQLDTVAQPSALAWQLAIQFWPGALTLVLPKQGIIPAIVSAGQETVAVRVPAHPVAIALLHASGVAIAAPSANRSNRPSPTTAAHVIDDLAGRIDLVLDGGSTAIGVESTILDLTSPVPTLLRPGGISYEQLQAVIPNLELASRYQQPHNTAAKSPGLFSKHYSPQAEFLLFAGSPTAVLGEMQAIAAQRLQAGQSVGMLCVEGDRAALTEWASQWPNHALTHAIVILSLGTADQLDQIAHGLFAGLRQLDRQGVDVILSPSLPTTGLGLAIADRLLRAASGQVIQVD